MTLYLGIDGGGSNLRVAIVDAQMQPLTIVRRGTANPSVIGRERATARIQEAMREALSEVEGEVAGVGIGIAGASAAYASDWLHDVVRGVLPDAHIAAASDNEIALVGANGAREGVLLLSGTGSVSFGINATGESLQVGGWGYLLGDEGSGFWIGLQALKATTKVSDGQLRQPTNLKQRVLDELHLKASTDLIQWLYGQQPTPIPAVAELSRLVLEEAETGDAHAQHILVQAADALVHLANTTIRVLGMSDPGIAFAGGLLESQNRLSALVMDRLGLESHPEARYPPVIGAALLAQLTISV